MLVIQMNAGCDSVPSDIAQLPSDALRRPVLRQYPKSAFGHQNRSFSATLYDKYNFIEYSIQRNAAFCFPCRFFGNKCKAGPLQEAMFAVKGFGNWKKCDRIFDHSTCKFHKDSVVAWLAYKSASASGTVVQQQLGYHALVVRENREYVKSLARIAVFCGRQNIALRGHDERDCSSNRGNFLELVDLVATESKEFFNRKSSMPANSTYLSPDSQNALIEAAARCVLADIKEGIDKSGMYAIITDCCTDMVSDNLSVSVRYVDMTTCLFHERFLGFIDLSADDLDAESMTNKIVKTLQQAGRFEVPLEYCVSQASDGASVMSGKDNGVQKLFRDKVGNPCIFVHCYAHRLNLVLSVTATSLQPANEFFTLIRKTISFINHSIKRKAVFKDRQEKDPTKSNVLVLPDLCEHKWNFRERSVSVVHSRYKHVLETLAVIEETGKPDERFEAECIRAQLTKPVNVCLLVIMSDIFTQLSVLSDVLQAEKSDIVSVMQLAAGHLQVLREKRCDVYFHKLWLIMYDLAARNNIEMLPPSKRKSKAPLALRQFVNESTMGHRGSDTDGDSDTEVYHRTTVFFPLLDLLTHEMERRFNAQYRRMPSRFETVFGPGGFATTGRRVSIGQKWQLGISDCCL